MCELDNLAYAIGLVESVRVRAEYAGRCHLNELQAAELWWSKAVFMFVVPVGLLVPMPIIALGNQALYIVALFPIPFVSRFLPSRVFFHTATTQVARWTQGTILFGGLIDELLSPAKKEQGNLWLRLAKTAGSWVAGVICFGVLAMITISGKVGWLVLGMAVAVGVAANASQSGKGTE